MYTGITIKSDNTGDLNKRGFKSAVGTGLTKKVAIRRGSRQRQFSQEVQLYKREKKLCGIWEGVWILEKASCTSKGWRCWIDF